MFKNNSGFTLMELMVVVAIVGILSAIAIPNYQDSVKKSRRSDAQGALTAFANKMEQHYTQTNSYCDAAGTGGTAVTNCGTSANDTGSPAIFSTQSPVDGVTAYYNLTISTAGQTKYILTATPTNAQANDKCGILTLNNVGVRTATYNGADVSTSCW